MRIVLVLASVLALAACGSTTTTQPPDAAPAIDADIDAPPPPPPPVDAPPPPTTTQLTGGGHLSGGTLAVDLQIGLPTAQAPATGNAVVLDPATPIKP